MWKSSDYFPILDLELISTFFESVLFVESEIVNFIV